MALGLVAGKWQWGRYETKSHALHAQQRAAGLPTVPLESIMTTADTGPGAADWRTVTVTGVIDSKDLVQLRGRTIDNNASIQYLAWIRPSSGGAAVLLDLGWTPREQPQAPRIPSGVVTVTGVVRAFESDNGKQGTRIVPTQMGSAGGEVLHAYLMVDSACGAQRLPRWRDGRAAPRAVIGPAPELRHAVVAPARGRGAHRRVAHGARRKTRTRRPRWRKRARPSGTQRRGRGEPRRRQAKRAHPSDEEIEDAL